MPDYDACKCLVPLCICEQIRNRHAAKNGTVSLQIGYSSGQVSVHVVTPGVTQPPQGGLPSEHAIPVARIGTAIPPCHSPVACLSARCLHACDLDMSASEQQSESDPERAQRAAVDTSGPRILAVRCCYNASL